MRKIGLWILIFTIVTCLCACSGEPQNQATGVSSEQIQKDAENVEVEYSTKYVPTSDFKYISHDIIKRQTNTEDKEDLVYLESHYENDSFKIVAEIKLTYNFYDEGGWILDETDVEIKESFATKAPDLTPVWDSFEIEESPPFIGCVYKGDFRVLHFNSFEYLGVELNEEDQSAKMRMRFTKTNGSEVILYYPYKYSLKGGWQRQLTPVEGQVEVQINSRYGYNTIHYIAEVEKADFKYTMNVADGESFTLRDMDIENNKIVVTKNSQDYLYYFDPFSGRIYPKNPFNESKMYFDLTAASFSYNGTTNEWHR